MKLIRKCDLIASVANRWYEAYCSHGWQAQVSRDDKMETFNKLTALPADASEQQVMRIIGNSSWTSIQCDECQQEVDMAVRLGEEPDYESATAIVCLMCLRGALELAEGEQ